MDSPAVHEPPDLALLDEDDQHREVYAWAGLALYYAQVFEQAVINVIYAAQLADGTLAAAFRSSDEFFTTHGDQTLGRLLAALRQHLSLPEDVGRQCSEALRRRNFLVHHFFAERVELFVHEQGRQLLLAELHAAITIFRQGDQELENVMFCIGRRWGITREAVAHELEALRQRANLP